MWMAAKPFEEFAARQCVFSAHVHWPDAIPAYTEGHIKLASPWPWSGHHRGQRHCSLSRLCSSTPAKGILEREKLMELVSWKTADGGCCSPFPWGWVAARAFLGQRDWPQAWPSFDLEQLLGVSAPPLLQASPTMSCANKSISWALPSRVRSPASCFHLLLPAVAIGVSMQRNQEGISSSLTPMAQLCQ